MARVLSFLWLFLPVVQSFITWIEPRHPLKGTPCPPGSPWPWPQELINSSFTFQFSRDQFDIESNLPNCDIIIDNLERYQQQLFPDTSEGSSSEAPILQKLVITITSGICEKYLNLDSNESYEIVITEGDTTAVLSADSVWGAIRGLETFSQLIWQDTNNAYFVNATKITDSPRFKHRGLLLDGVRHFQPVSIIKKNLDAMQWNKLNVFHWHLTDDQAFPFESFVYPNLTKLGAYSSKHVYTQKEVAEIIEYARLRGIRVIPEIDSPGHTRAIGNAFPNLLTPCYGDGVHPYTPNYTEFSAMEIFNPFNPDVYSFMKTLASEIKSVFPDEFIHLGMDEVYYGCWKSNPDIKSNMDLNNYTEINQVEQHYVRHLVPLITDIGYKYITWQDPVDNNVTLANDTIVQVWKDKSLDLKLQPWRDYIVPIARKGYKMILSSCWYLNYIGYGEDWRKYYECDPHDFEGTEGEHSLVIGGEAAMWGEYVDGTNILSRLWPRTSAVAERLWSSGTVNDTDSAAFRLDQQRCRLLRRGIPAQPILNGYCGDYEAGFN